jgi:CBS domain-containing protein
MSRRIVPDLVSDQRLTIVAPSCSVMEAAKQMAYRNIGAVIVAENGSLVGVFTERDMTQRVVARGRNPEFTVMSEVMTPDPTTVAPGDNPMDALMLMRRLGCRHLPVVEGGRIVGMLSIRDLYPAIHEELAEDLKLRDELFMGSGYSITH